MNTITDRRKMQLKCLAERIQEKLHKFHMRRCEEKDEQKTHIRISS